MLFHEGLGCIWHILAPALVNYSTIWQIGIAVKGQILNK